MDWNDILGQVTTALLPIVATLITAGVAWLGKRIDTWLTAKIEHEYLQAASRRLNEATWTVVLEMQQTSVDALKAATAEDSPGGRSITKEEVIELRSIALAKLKTYLGPVGLQSVKKVLGVDDSTLEEVLLGAIESTVRNNKDSKETAALQGGKARPVPTEQFGTLLTTEGK